MGWFGGQAAQQAALGQEWAAAIELMTEGLAVEGTNDPQLTTALESGKIFD